MSEGRERAGGRSVAGPRARNEQGLARRRSQAAAGTRPPACNAPPAAVTHTHLDHVGALPLLLKDFPNTPVLVHEREKAQLLQGRQHGRLLALVLRAAGLASPQADRVRPAAGRAQLAAPSPERLRWEQRSLRAAQHGGSARSRACPRMPTIRPSATASTLPPCPPPRLRQVPAGRLTVLEEPFGSLDSIGLQSVVYLLTPGHSPGHVVYLCSGADALLAGDAVSLLKPRLRLGAPPSHASVGGSAADAPRPTPQVRCQQAARPPAAEARLQA